MFTTNYQDIIQQIEAIDPIKYGKTRNYINGAVTKLSPYISRGVITTKQIAQTVLNKGYKHYEIDSFLKELAWRDYYQQVWIAKGDAIDRDLKQEQPRVNNHQIASSVVNHTTKIEAIDDAIANLYQTGYMHNHARMYLASICCNIGQSHWFTPAKWMFYYLFDADWASNALSWQWVASSFSSKKYYANQENVNKYCNTSQKNTFIDCSYEDFDTLPIPNELKDLQDFNLTTPLPTLTNYTLNESLPTYIYNFYNLDCKWDTQIKANRVLLIEPSYFEKYPVSENTIKFIFGLAKNITHIQIVVGEFNDIFNKTDDNKIFFKEHPTNEHYKGNKQNRTFMFEKVTGYYPSFFAYWKNCEKNMRSLLT